MPEAIDENEFKVTLPELGWSNHYIQQLTLDEWDEYIPARVIEQHRSELLLATENKTFSIPVPSGLDDPITVGDWLLLDKGDVFFRLLDRSSLFKRKAAGAKVGTQLIAANVDTVLIVCSMNHDFNLNRLERYLVLANDADVEPVIILTKADLCDSEEVVKSYVDQAQTLGDYLMVVAVNGLDNSELHKLSPWCRPGKTLALLGSSGVGKSTLANLLVGGAAIATAGVREDDSKGRHTTTSRSLHMIPKTDALQGGILLDTPGMRELQLVNVEEGIEETFSDIMMLAEQCRFSDCSHDIGLPETSGCAVQSAIVSGELLERRLLSFQKLQREDALNSSTIAERRDKDKQFGKMIRSVVSEKKNRNK